MDGPFIPEGEPVKKGVSTDGTKHWKEYADGSRIQTDPDGTNHYAYPDNAPHGIKQYSMLTNGTSMIVYGDGRRIQKCTNGTTLEVYPNGLKIQTNPDGVKIENRPDQTTLQTNPNGVTVESFPDGLKIQKNPDTGIEHHLYPDGRDVQVNPDGSKIEHFADGTTRQITADGDAVDLKKVGEEEASASGVKATVYEVDTTEADAAAVREATEKAAAAELRRKQAEEEEHKARLQKDLEELQKKKEAEEAKRLAAEAADSKAAMAAAAADREQAALQKQLADAKSVVPAAPKGMSFIKMKMYLKKNGADRSRVDNCLGKYELEKLADELGIEFPAA